MTPVLSPQFRKALLRRHKKRQRNGLWCEKGCPFHRQVTAEEVWNTHIGGWTFMYVDTVDRMAKEGQFD
ncbi:hypothetical protein Ssi03_13390 [Sphaerisporangium siamense]|uniref:Uncharacterized protein n=1 Tax=Sphaerisporangium siamense TaxID=795645 RepID=A0A7W7GAZ5_9ACTN|nr:hypothetical protein [Sphaerisporangium siamense]MBB4702892.1 hypothetical protein [Sphaerisporangium siamense]GII83349.1 hypothetical protein Ssi03_13390 [Sphaerisporangium siamense]